MLYSALNKVTLVINARVRKLPNVILHTLDKLTFNAFFVAFADKTTVHPFSASYTMILIMGLMMVVMVFLRYPFVH